ncbi:MAG: hypothetical protein RR313_07295 [Anaerovoracaceae bacterium]
MKKTRFFLVALLIVVMMSFAGCSSDDMDNEKAPKVGDNPVENYDDQYDNGVNDNADKNLDNDMRDHDTTKNDDTKDTNPTM